MGLVWIFITLTLALIYIFSGITDRQRRICVAVTGVYLASFTVSLALGEAGPAREVFFG